MNILIYYVGKARDVHANALAGEFLKRSSRYAACAMREIVPKRFSPFKEHRGARIFCLDPAGTQFSSRQFTALVSNAEQLATDLVFVVGGHDGLPGEWRAQGELLSLSPLTMPHELARAVLAEQIYRALTTLRGHPYPR